jgi:hypothetical protein
MAIARSVCVALLCCSSPVQVKELRKIVPEPASYVSESNFFEKDWQHSYWGVNYERLQAVKRQYDPDGLFFAHHGVGSEDWSDDGFERRAAN